MSYHVAINGVQSGPHSEHEVQGRFARGELKPTDLCWREGWPQWRPVGEVFSEPPPMPAVSSDSFAKASANAADQTEALRREHLTHEASIQSVGSLYCLGGFLVALVAVASLVGGAVGSSETGPAAVGVGAGMAVVLGGIAAIQFWVGLGLRRLNPKATIPATILAAIGLFGFPLGTLINGYVLYLLHSRKGKVVLGEGYREIVQATPHIRYKTPAWLIVVVVLLVLLVLIGIATAVGSS